MVWLNQMSSPSPTESRRLLLMVKRTSLVWYPRLGMPMKSSGPTEIRYYQVTRYLLSCLKQNQFNSFTFLSPIPNEVNYLNVVLLVARQHEKSKTEEAFPYQVQSQVKLELLALLKQIFEHKNNYCFSFGFQLNPLYFTVYFREDKKSQTVGL